MPRFGRVERRGQAGQSAADDDYVGPGIAWQSWQSGERIGGRCIKRRRVRLHDYTFSRRCSRSHELITD